MVFPLDLPESGKAEGSGVPVKHSPATAAASTPVVQGGEQEVGKRDGRSLSPSKVPAQSAKRKSSREKPEKRARFYPLPNKQESPAKVRECQVSENGQVMRVTSSMHRRDLIQRSHPGACSHKTNVVGDPYSRYPTTTHHPSKEICLSATCKLNVHMYMLCRARSWS